MIGYFDTSALATLVLRDARWEQLARRTDEKRIVPIYSDFGWGELLSAIGLRYRRGELTRSAADGLIVRATSFTTEWGKIDCASTDLMVAADLVSCFERGLKFPDAIHVAIAAHAGCTLVTTDNQQAAAARMSGVPVFSPFEEPK